MIRAILSARSTKSFTQSIRGCHFLFIDLSTLFLEQIICSIVLTFDGILEKVMKPLEILLLKVFFGVLFGDAAGPEVVDIRCYVMY